ncbi:MAG: hypothetical protein ACLFTT_17215 [Candidatus Hydrogenedentota bacterium]
MRVLFFIIAVAIVAVVLAFVYGAIEEEPGGADRPPEEATKEEVMEEIAPLLDPVRGLLRAETGGYHDAMRESIVSGLRDAKMKYAESPGGKKAFQELSWEVVGMAKQARAQDRWRLVQGFVDIHNLLGMESVTIERLDESARKRLAQPLVEVTGVVDDVAKEQTYVFMNLLDRDTREINRVKARVGETVGDLKVVEIVGRNKKVVLEYLPIEGLTFEVDFS